MTLLTTDAEAIRATYALAHQSMLAGGRPFAAMIAIRGELRIQIADAVLQNGDPTAHPEIESIRAFVRRFNQQELRKGVMYASAEPCPMCAGAIHYSGIGRLVFGVSRERLDEIVSSQRLRKKKHYRDCRLIIGDGGITEVVGPTLEDEGLLPLNAYCFVTRTQLVKV